MTTLRSCEYCRHFCPDELNTGFCQRHEMFVLKDFDCGKFEPRPLIVEGGEVNPDRIMSEKMESSDVPYRV
ncbi:hypothetical protein U14_01195 [Candidatus Moduliflexus flocculans]|uniref:Uncharacterized protein n=1 Tax=Candidatus Moduliflexus flocculans TaxID=1499966 RepID=A0A0S6VRU9_9BACT|nr:hypothetical protein U14_01195 [Candidatus Moduliflexus flocculans]